MAPLIDIVFLLLIFFMLSSSFLKPSLKLDLPQASQSGEQNREHILITVDKEKNIFINMKPTLLDSLKSDISEELMSNSKKSVHLQGDRSIPYGLFVKIMDYVRQGGATQINLVHEPIE